MYSTIRKSGDTEVITIHPKGNMNVFIRFHFHGSPLDSCSETSFKTTNVNLLMVLEEKRVGFIFCW